MLLIVLTGLLLAGLSCALVARGLAIPRIRTTERLEAISAYGFPAPGAGTPASQGSNVYDLLAVFGRVVGRRAPGLRPADLDTQLVRAGMYSVTSDHFLGARAAALVGLPLFCAWFAVSAGTGAGLAFLFVLGGSVAGWQFPLSYVRIRGERRLEQIEHELPELVDLLVVMVEAGLGFNGAMKMAAGRVEGPLGDELSLTLQEQRMGLSTQEALEALLTRCDTPSMRSFVRSILQGEKLGVSIGDIMRALALEMRKRRRQAAEERAHKAPVKLLFPLVFLIFPALFVVVLYPGVHGIINSLGQVA